MTRRNVLGWFGALPLRHPRATMVVVVLLTIASLATWPGVRFEPDVSRLLPAGHPHTRIAALLDDRSRPARALWLLIREPDLVHRVPELALALRRSPLVANVATTRQDLFEAYVERAVQAPLWYLSDAEIERLQATLGPAGRRAAIDALRLDLADDPVAAHELAVRDPLGLRWLYAARDPAHTFGLRADTDLAILADGTQALMRVTGTTTSFDADFATALMDHVERTLAGVDYDAFGGYAVARGDQARIRADFERSSLWSLAAIALYLCWVMRGWRLPLLVQLPATLSIAWAIPLGSLWFGPLPTVAVAAVAVLGGLGVDFAIHYAAHYRAARLQHAHGDAVRIVQAQTTPELLIDMATTAVTFLAVGSSALSGLRSFGFLLALGLVASVLVTLTALPILIRFAGDRRDPERSWLAGLADRWARRRRARPVAFGTIAAMAVGAVFVFVHGVPLRASTDALRPDDDATTLARARIESRLGFSTVPVALLWPMDLEPSPLLAGLHRLQQCSVLRFWSGIEAADTSVARARVAAFREATHGFVDAAEADFAAAGLSPEPFRAALEELAGRIAADPPAVAANVVELDGERFRIVSAWPNERLEHDNFPAFAAAVAQQLGPRVQVHGGPTVLRELEHVLRADLHRALVLATLLAMVMVGIWLRSVRYGLLALLPSSMGMCATLLALVAFGVPLSLISFVSIPFVLGIGVDEGVHLVGHFRHGAVATGATGVGVARTSLGTVLGFSSLWLATSPGLVELGCIVAFGSFCSMLAGLFVLTPLLASREPRGHQSGAQQNQ